tara:strand:- start:2204 stop:2530 length:327 start_codon:yes stop_codon:yes gene_type:complete
MKGRYAIMKTLPTNGMPFEMMQQIQASKYGHPNAYPNSEHIKPPMEKERIRVVEQATRAEVKLTQTKAIEERYKEIQVLRDQAAIRYNRDGTTVSPGETQGQFIDLEV